MELERAREIVQALADGVDPYTGDRFPPESPYQRADTVRAQGAIKARPCHGVAFRRRRVVKMGIIEDTSSNRAGQGNRPPDAPPESQPAPVDPENCPF